MLLHMGQGHVWPQSTRTIDWHITQWNPGCIDPVRQHTLELSDFIFLFFCVAWRSTSPVTPTPSLKKLHFMYIAYSVLVLLFSSFISGKKKLQYFSTNKHHLHFLKNLSLLFHAPRVHPNRVDKSRIFVVGINI